MLQAAIKSTLVAAAGYLCGMVDSGHLRKENLVLASRLPDGRCSDCGCYLSQVPGRAGSLDGLVHPSNHLCLWYVSLSLTATVTAAQRTVTRSNMAISPFRSAWFAA